MDTDYAWAAGFLDGEGCFYLQGTSKVNPLTKTPSIKATQVDPRPLLKLQEIFEGAVSPRNIRTSTGKIAHDWNVHGGEGCRRVLPFILPYMTTRAEEASILLQYAEIMRSSNKGSWRLSAAEEEQRKILIEALGSARKARENGAREVHMVTHAAPIAKLTEDQARTIKYDLNRPATYYANLYGVSVSTACSIRRGKAWSHI